MSYRRDARVKITHTVHQVFYKCALCECASHLYMRVKMRRVSLRVRNDDTGPFTDNGTIMLLPHLLKVTQ